MLAAIAAIATATVDVWIAAGVAELAGSGTWTTRQPSSTLLLDLVRGRFDTDLGPQASRVAFFAVLIAVVVAELIAVIVVFVLLGRHERVGDRRRSLLRRRDLGDLAGEGSLRKARQLRPKTVMTPGSTEQGTRLLRIDGHDVWMSWEDVALIIMGPRSNKTSAIAVPSVLSAPGLVVATSNKADLWALTRGLRGNAGPVWTFDPQQIAYAEQTWWWDPLRSIRDAPEANRVEAAARLAGHFMSTIGGTRRDPFFHAAGEQVLTATLLAAALSRRSIRDVIAWLQPGRRDAIKALDEVGADIEAGDLDAALSGADVTTKGIFQTARTATKSLTSERILRWITPPHTWRHPPLHKPAELDPWELLAAASAGPATLHLLSKEGAGTAGPIVAALVDRVLEVAELLAQAGGGRLDPPVVAVLDEAANICPITQLPQLYSHYGSRGIQAITILQSYQQGVGVWGEQGMEALWSAATIKLIGAGVDDHTFLQRLSGLIGDHDVEKVSMSMDRGRGTTRQFSTAREPVLPSSTLRALSKDNAVLLATGCRPGLGRLLPWYRERENTDIHTYADTALDELRCAAAAALGPGNPVNHSRQEPRDER
ncbi:TraM recognition domain-containing protein [Pseudonocardia sp. GCM10023141]|uniref:TraM recognition domain-containing protein n=1 Tax=Pseudonocardia sp. GCM10023141 TaxID=3252653 RepID=UPI003610A93A